MNNCAGGTTPWGTCSRARRTSTSTSWPPAPIPREKRYGLSGTQDTRNWRSVDPRWDATNPDYANEPNRFGWIVEIDPHDPDSTPVKHTAMGRFKHEGANVDRQPRTATSSPTWATTSASTTSTGSSPATSTAAAAARATGGTTCPLLSEGDLSVARFTGDGLEDGVSDGTGEWIPLTRNGQSMVPGFTLEEVLVFTRLAADAVQPTKMDRPEDVQPNLHNGRIYVACTNNTDRGKPGKEGADRAQPARRPTRTATSSRSHPQRGDHTAATFSWNLILICGDPATAGTYFGGYTGPVSPIACPDNVAFDSVGNLWISTDGQPSALAHSDGLYKVPVAGPERGRVQQFLAVPAGAETCGPVIHDRDGSVFVAVQHPGEDGTWAAPQSRFPDYVAPGSSAPKGDFAGPRPTVVQVTRS